MFKKIFTLTALFVTLFGFYACDEIITPDPEKPEPIVSLEANSIDNQTVGLKFEGSPSESNALFDGYYLKITPGTFPEEKIPVGSKNLYKVQGLTEGTEYTFTVYAKYTNGEVSLEKSIKWSPATRYSADIRVYEYASTRGSGLNLNDASGEPTTLTIANASKWDICLDTRNDKLVIGSPKASDYTDANFKFGNGQSARDLDVYNVYTTINDLDDVFDTKAINEYANPTQKVYDFTNSTTGFVMFVKTYPGTSSYYAKVLVKANNGKILQGTAPDRYVQLSVSYQKVAGVPYAKFEYAAPVVRLNNSNK